MSFRIVHISDLHIRPYKRLDEYKKSIENLISSVTQQKPDIIVLTGDLVHTKTNISTNQMLMLSELLRSLKNIAKVVMVAGNHDCIVNNQDLVDALTPVVDSINDGSQKILYLKGSGVCDFNKQVDFVVFSCLDPADKWPKKHEINPDKINIGLYHDLVKEVELQPGIMADIDVSVHDLLDKVDYCLMGDYHAVQSFGDREQAAYAGSCIQQSFAESVDKGYLVWDIESKTKHKLSFVKLPNVCPFYTIDLAREQKIESLNIPKGSRIRVLGNNIDMFEKQQLKAQIGTLFDPEELKIIDEAEEQNKELSVSSLGVKVENLEDENVQETMIRKFLEEYKLDSDLLKKIVEINKKYNEQLQEQHEMTKNVQYKIGKVKWSNFCSYGEGNEFDFSKYKGILGILGKNACGKSCIAVDIPLYTMFNRISKNVTKNDLLINEHKDSMCSEIEIMVGQNKHIIQRQTSIYLKSGKKEKNPVYQGKTDVNYKVIHPDGREESRNGSERSETDNDFIQKDFGNMEDFIDTSVAPQWQLLNFINKGATERQRLIGRYFNIDIFEKKFDLVKKDIRNVKSELSILQEKDYDNCIKDQEQKLILIDEKLKENNDKKHVQDMLISDLMSECDALRTGYFNVSRPSKTVQQLESEIATKLSSISQLQKRKEEAKTSLDQRASYDIDLLKSEKAKWENVFDLEKGASILEKGCKCKHEESCTHYSKIKKYKDDAAKIRLEMKISYDKICQDMKSYEKIKVDNSDYDFMIEQAESIVLNLKKELERIDQNKEQLRQNELINEQIQAKKVVIEKEKSLLNTISRNILSLTSDRAYIVNQIENDKRSVEKLKELKVKYDALNYYSKVVAKDGVVRSIISENISLINKEIEKIMSQGVGFLVELESSDEGKAIEVYFKHPKSKRRHIDLTSGMERTIAAIAIRAALVNISTLPKSNLFVIDEAFESLDPEYMSGLVSMLEYFKKMFDTIIIVTHLEQFKDIVDHVVQVDRDENGFSKIYI